mgnify:CR=1 FL=1
MLMLLTLKVDPDRVSAICQDLIRFGHVRKVLEVTGEFDVFALVEAKSVKDFRDFLEERVSKLPGVRRTETYLVLEEWK